mmetsp:Transcript_33093/g.38473  ORF Transcript_33093/g.38473 Transcript_33093/m.38473 type:complete len:126 (-) Transcript_33093:224-601(-)
MQKSQNHNNSTYTLSHQMAYLKKIALILLGLFASASATATATNKQYYGADCGLGYPSCGLGGYYGGGYGWPYGYGAGGLSAVNYASSNYAAAASQYAAYSNNQAYSAVLASPYGIYGGYGYPGCW